LLDYDEKEIYINMLTVDPDNFFTGFPQKMWITLKSPIVINACLVILCLSLLSSCSYFKGSKKQDKSEQAPAATAQSDQKEPDSSKPGSEKKTAAPDKEPPKSKLTPDTSVIDMTEAEVKKKFGEPDVVSKMPDNRILWTYYPAWKIMPDNKDTVYIEFVNGRVVKIIRAR